VYVADTFNNRIQRFTATGGYLGQWGVQGSGDGQVSLPYGIAVDAKGDVYVADTYNHRIQKFTAAGVYIKPWGGIGSGNGQFQCPNGLVVDAGGSVYVADTNNPRIERFTSKGLFLAAWGNEGNGAGDFQFPQGVAIGPDEDLRVSDTSNHRMQLFRRRNGQGHESTLTMGGPGIGNGLFSDVRGVAVSKDGFVYAADKSGCRMQKFTTTGSWVLAWGASGSADGQFNDPVGVALDTTGVVYVVDHGNNRVEKFSPSGTYLGKWGSTGTGNGQFTAPWDIAIDDSNRVYVVDAHRIQRFTTAGGFVAAWPCSNAAGVGVDAEGYVYAACGSPDHVVRKFSPAGQLVLTWGGQGNGVGQFVSPCDVVYDRFGYVYVADANDRVQQFTPMGGYIEEWGEPGSGFRQIGAPTMMAADTDGNVYIGEFSNYRVHKFASPPELYKVEDVPGDNGGFVRLSFVPTSVPPAQILFYRVRRTNDAGNVLALDFQPGPTSVIVPSGGNGNDAFDGMSEYDLLTALFIQDAGVPASMAFGFSTDDLAPPAPSPFTGVYQAGATWLHWGASPAGDLDEYRLSRGGFQIHASPDTGYSDVGPAGGFYSIVAVDTSGNVSAAATLGPDQTVDTPPATLTFALEGMTPNPAPNGALTLRFTLPDALPARLELVNVAGRSVWSRAVQGTGPHALRPAEAFAPGIYFVRLTRGAQSLVRRAVVLD
jgi:sugar lactone lactonase YvrE